MPPMAAKAEPMMKVMEMTLFTSIPTSIAMVRSWEVARIALPMRENLISKVSPTIASAVVSRITISEDPTTWA